MCSVCVCAGLLEVNCLRTSLPESITARPTPGRSAAVTPVCVKGLLLVLKCLLLSPLVYFTYFSSSSVTLLYSLFYSLLLSFSFSALLLTFFYTPHTSLACFLILGLVFVFVFYCLFLLSSFVSIVFSLLFANCFPFSLSVNF